MPSVLDINIISVTLEIEKNRSLFILLARDGTVNRQGTGTIDNKETDLYIGVAQDPLFEHVLTFLSGDMLEHMGDYDLPDPKGAPCRLAVGLEFKDGEENGFGFNYGAESEGPPEEIAELLIAAIQITDPWYQSQKEMTSKKTDPV